MYAECPGGKVRAMKLLLEDPANYSDVGHQDDTSLVPDPSFLLACFARSGAKEGSGIILEVN